MTEEILRGGVANVGSVVRSGETVTRPAPQSVEAIHRLLDHLANNGFEAPQPLGEVSAERETLTFIHGDVPIPPYPAWSLSDEALESVGVLLRRYHDAVRSFSARGLDWSTELADPEGVELVCHNDVCLENVVFRDGRAVALLDFDYAAPGRVIWDVAMTAGMCVPIRPPEDPLAGQGRFDPFARLASFARAYGLPPDQSRELVVAIGRVKEVGAAFVQRHVNRGDEGFIRMVDEQGSGAWQRRLEWYRENQARFVRVLEMSP